MHSGFWLLFHSAAWACWCLRLGLVALGWLGLAGLWAKGAPVLWHAAHHLTGDPELGPDPFAPVLAVVASGALFLFLGTAAMGWAWVLL